MALTTGNLGPIMGVNTTDPSVVRQLIAALAYTQGVVAAGDMLVSQHAGTINRSVDVAAGFALISGTSSTPSQGMYGVFNNGVVNVAIAASDPTNARIDRLLLQVQENLYDASGNNLPRFVVVAGTPSGSPALPSLAGYASYLELAQITVLAGGAGNTIDNAHITDVRVRKGGAGTPVSAAVLTNETCTSAAFTDIGTFGPSVTVLTGTQARVDLVAQLQNGAVGGGSSMGFAVSGATTIAASDPFSLYSVFGSAVYTQNGASFLLTGLTPGINTFTCKYKYLGASPADFVNRRIIVTPS